MPEKRKKKRSLYATFEHIERYHRRSVLVMHAVLSLALQIAMWFNWYGSYAAHGLGFSQTFFTDRITISIVLTLFLAGHFIMVRLLESKDRMVVQALRQHEDEIDDEDVDDENDEASEVESSVELPIPHEEIDELEPRRIQRRL